MASKPERTYGYAHRKLRRLVLDRAGHRCQRIDPDTGEECGRPATHAGHIVAKVDGGRDVLDNYRAECSACNLGDGARLGNRRRQLNPPGRHPFFGVAPTGAPRPLQISLPDDR